MESIKNKLIIGSAQFGLDYGVTNLDGRVSKDKVRSIIEKARFHQIMNLDTASSYGSSENVLGSLGIKDFNVITKLPSFDGVTSEFDFVCQKIIKKSLSNLKVQMVDTVLLHRPEELLGSDGDSIFKALSGLKEHGYTKKIGISIYAPEILNEIFSKYTFDVVQVPLNIFDRRIITSGWLKKLTDKNISVIARSVFLQGILLAKLNDLPMYFHNWASFFDNWVDFYYRNELTALEASLQFVAQIPEINKIIVGVENENQFFEILKALEKPRMIDSSYLTVNDLGLISPNYWQNK